MRSRCCVARGRASPHWGHRRHKVLDETELAPKKTRNRKFSKVYVYGGQVLGTSVLQVTFEAASKGEREKREEVWLNKKTAPLHGEKWV